MDTAEVRIDALPYYDKEYSNEDIKTQVSRLISSELSKHSRPTSHHADASIFTKTTLFPSSELSRIASNLPLSENGIDKSRYRVEPPYFDEDEEISSTDKVEGWRKAVENAYSQLEHQRDRLVNLELLNRFGANGWKYHTFQLESAIAAIEAEIKQVKGATTELNRQRKVEQTKAGNQLQVLASREMEMISRISVQLEQANAALQRDLEEKANAASS